MFNIVSKFIEKMDIDSVNNFARSKNINLSNEELDFTYNFIKKNYSNILKSNSLFDIDRYKSRYSEENFNKIKKVYTEYYSKYNKFF